ncbi:unnamed protein product [Tetraodon nigroviridis]|uniref:(spotted green pufferfish) hypothetical protein n=1 Tax=Tetraodon nigroviridis TaxID=99883 RepID=Q4S842_TETNG|nr:unnamed protein product [Tetraodon nigroviridis]
MGELDSWGGPEGKSTTSCSTEINSSTPLGSSVRSSAQQIGSELPQCLGPYGLHSTVCQSNSPDRLLVGPLPRNEEHDR